MNKHVQFLLVLIILTLVISDLKADDKPLSDTLNVLFIGNSFTKNNYGVPYVFKKISNTAGHPVHVERVLHDGWSIRDFIHDAACRAMVSSMDWDYIVLQDLQYNYCDSIGVFPPSVIDDNVNFQKAIKELKPCAKIIYVAGWDKKEGNKEQFPNDDFKHCIQRMMINYQYLNSRTGVNNIIAPVGLAWSNALNNKPDAAISLYAVDNRHPAANGTYLYALVIYVVMFKNNPISSEYLDNVSGSDMPFFCNMAYQTVRDTISYTNAAAYTIKIKHFGNMLTAEKGYHHYQWFKNNVMIKKGAGFTANLMTREVFIP